MGKMDRRTFLRSAGIAAASLSLSRCAYADRNPGLPDIYLTIDDGPTRYTDSIVGSIDRDDHATFFMIGTSLDSGEGHRRAVNVLENGHDIGNHSYTHTHFSKMPLSQVKREIESTDLLLRRLHSEVGVRRKKLFRFPNGDRGSRTYMSHGSAEHERQIAKFLDDMGYYPVGWTHNIEDWKFESSKDRKGLGEIMSDVRSIKPFDIVLAHERAVTARYVIPYYSAHFNLIRLPDNINCE